MINMITDKIGSLMIFGVAFGVALLLFCAIIMMINRMRKRSKPSPKLTVLATVITKKSSVTHCRTGYRRMGDYLSETETTYYATFQVESGDRLELLVPEIAYGMLTEGDIGKLSFQGNRFISFNRT